MAFENCFQDYHRFLKVFLYKEEEIRIYTRKSEEKHSIYYYPLQRFLQRLDIAYSANDVLELVRTPKLRLKYLL